MKRIIFTLCALSVFFSSFSQIPNYLPTSGLIAWYPFSGNVNDLSGNGNNGLNNGATLTNDRFGTQNSAYGFNGSSSYIQLPSSIQPPQISISFWFKLGSTTQNQSLIRNRYWAYSVMWNPNITEFGAAGANKLVASLSLDSTAGKQYFPIFQQAVYDGNWHHIAFSFDGLIYKVYLDNVSVYSSSSVGSGNIKYNNQGNGFAIGRDGDFSSWYFNGLIDDVSIYNRSLSQTEVNSIYTQTALPCQVTVYDTTHVIVYDTTQVIKYDTVKTYISVTDTLLINVTISGLTAPNNTNTLKVYPNPAKDKLVISTGSYSSMLGYTIKVTNALGQIVLLSAINHQEYIIDLSSWTGNGFYFLTITDPLNKIVEVKKIILE